jgi:hypothetical protein
MNARGPCVVVVLMIAVDHQFRDYVYDPCHGKRWFVEILPSNVSENQEDCGVFLNVIVINGIVHLQCYAVIEEDLLVRIDAFLHFYLLAYFVKCIVRAHRNSKRATCHSLNMNLEPKEKRNNKCKELNDDT